jgi:CubicO group peptidase (beta-lactamase class C family)
MIPPTFQDYIPQYEKKISNYMATNRIPGLAIALIHDGKKIYQKCFGTRNRAKNVILKAPMTPETLVNIASCTKSFTAIAIMQLSEANLLDINKPVQQYLPEFRLGSNSNPITIHHLLSHSSGIPFLDSTSVSLLQGLDVDTNIPLIPLSSSEDYYRFINDAKSELLFKPGEKFFYCNDGFNLLGQIIERISGEKYEDYILKHIFQPLSMTRSGFETNHSLNKDVNSDIAVGYSHDKKKLIPTPFAIDKFSTPEAGIFSNLDDLCNYVLMNLNEGQFNGHPILDPKSINQMQSYTISEDAFFKAYLPGPFGKVGYGYGWVVFENFYGTKLIRHGGNTGSFSSNIAFIPEFKMGVISLSNCGIMPTPLITSALVSLMGMNPEEKFPLFAYQSHLKNLVGKYTTFKNIWQIEIYEKLGYLYLKDEDGITPLIPASEELINFEFYSLSPYGGRIPAKFLVGDNNQIYFTTGAMLYHKEK